MSSNIVLPLIFVPLIVIGGLVWYRRALRRLEPDDERRDVSGVRLTSEHLRRLPCPPWRVVFEIGSDRLGSVDHVVIGPPGVIAISTVMADRPDGAISTDPALVADVALRRGAVGDLVEPVGIRCDRLAKVFWGAPQPNAPAGLDLTHGSVGVIGMHMIEWLEALPPDVLSPSQVDLAWQAVVTGIGRPDPLY